MFYKVVKRRVFKKIPFFLKITEITRDFLPYTLKNIRLRTRRLPKNCANKKKKRDNNKKKRKFSLEMCHSLSIITRKLNSGYLTTRRICASTALISCRVVGRPKVMRIL